MSIFLILNLIAFLSISLISRLYYRRMRQLTKELIKVNKELTQDNKQLTTDLTKAMLRIKLTQVLSQKQKSYEFDKLAYEQYGVTVDSNATDNIKH